jgi:hypothetical protein
MHKHRALTQKPGMEHKFKLKHGNGTYFCILNTSTKKNYFKIFKILFRSTTKTKKTPKCGTYSISSFSRQANTRNETAESIMYNKITSNFM